MENGLYSLKNKNKNLKVSSVRFANVSFSNGSLLQNIYNRMKNKSIWNTQKYKKIFYNTQGSLTFMS